MDIASSALLLVDSQNDFLSRKGKLYGKIKSMLVQQDMPNRLNVMIHASRKAGIQIVHTPIVLKEGRPGGGTKPLGMLALVAKTYAFVENTWGAEVADVLNFNQTDWVIKKNRICAFEGTDLDSRLKNKGIDTLFVAGMLADQCVESTLRIACDKGYLVYAVTDATVALDPVRYAYTIKYGYPDFSLPIKHTDFLKLLQSRESTPLPRRL